MKRTINVFLGTVGLFLVMLLMVGCSTDKKESNSNKNTSSTEKIELEMWLTPQWKGVFDPSEDKADYDSFFKEAAKRYKEKNPNVKVNVQVIPAEQRADKLSVAMQTKELPDMFFDSSFALSEYAHMGALEPLDDIIDQESKEDIPAAIWDNVSIDDKVYFYPFGHNPGTLAYNADMFKEAGLDKYIGGEHEIVTWSLDDLKTITKTLREKNSSVEPFGLFAKNNQGDTWNMSYMKMFGNPFFGKDGEIVVNRKDGVKALNYINQLRKDGLTTRGAETLASNDVNAMFQNKQIAISFANSVLFNGILKDMKDGKVDPFDMRLANIPGEKQPITFTYVTSSVVFNTENKITMKEAKKFVEFYSTDKELIKASKNTLPVRDSISKELENEIPYLNAYKENSKYITNFSNNSPGYAELRNTFFPELQAVFTGEKNPEQALNDFAKQGNRIIKENKKKSVILNN